MQISDYLSGEKLHQGKNSTIYRGIKKDSTDLYILKIIEKKTSYQQDVVQLLKKEYQFVSEVNSEYVIKAVDWIEDKDYAAIVFEDIQGITLKDELKHSPLPLEQFMKLAAQVTAGLVDIHRQNIIHQDINPTNIIWNSQTGNLNIIDFNIASNFDLKVPYSGNPEKLQGTLPYISPEQSGRMNCKVDQRSDLYSLGVTFYEMLTGKLPFEQRDPMELVYAHLARDPEPPHAINKQIPGILSNIILKLLAKNPEDRYQSAEGLRHDLYKVAQLNFKDFKLGERDFPGKLQIPGKLYGREKEIEQLLNAYQRVSKGAKEMILVAGYSGTGKTALVNEINKPITKDNGFFINGKADQLQRNVPYFSFIQAIAKFCDLLLTEKEALLAVWKQLILQAVGKLGKVLTDIIPQLETIIGKQPDIPQIDDVEARNRFNYVFQRFIKAIATEKHPIVMFIDDLQWSDHASFNLLNLLMTDPQNQFILFIGAYRNNEVFPTHPLMVITEELRHQDVSLSTIEVGNLSESNIQDLLKDTLRGANPVQNQDVNNLAALIHRKTDGNAFFTVQFLEKLYKEGFLIFDPVQSSWKWDMKEINRLAITENVVDLLLHRIKLFPQSVQDVLKLSACAGNTFALETLSVIAGKDAQIHESLEIALRENLIYPLDDRQYKFMHDRIQQAAYALISEDDKKPVHLKIGRLLLREFGEHESIEYLEKMGQRIFDIANHFNIGIEFVTAEEEKIKIARLNLKAAQKAKAAIAYGPAWEYVRQALRLLPDNSWKQNYDLTIAVYNEAIHIAFLVGNYTEIKHLSDIVLNFSAKIMDKSTVYEYQILLLITQNEFAKAVDTSSKILCSLGIDIPEKLCEKDMEIFTKTKALLEQIGIEGLKNLPPLKDEKKQLAMRVYLRTAAAISLAAQDLYPFMINKMLLLSLEFGETPETPYLLTEYAMMNACMGNIADAYKYSTLSMTLLSKLKGFDAMEVRLLTLNYAYIFHWKDPLKELSIGYWEIHQRAIQAGDSEYAAYALMVYFLYLRYTDENLAVVVRKGKNVLEIINQLKQPYQKGLAEIWFQVIENLSGNKQNPTKLPDLDSLPPTLTDDSRRMQYFYITASQLFLNCFFENREIIDCTDIVQKSPILSTCYEYPNYVFYSAILKLQVIKEAALTEKQKMFDEVKECQEKLKEWADFGPDNFLHRYYLLKAELANVNGHMYEAAEFYDKAIETANKNEFLCDEALSNELAAKFYLQNQRESLAVCYFRKAYQCYRQWGAIAKVKHLEENYPKYLSMGFPGTKLTVTGTISSESTDTTDEFLDVKSIINASQTLSGEVQLAPLLEKMMHILIKNAGAQKSMLIENIDHCLLIQAEGTADGVSGILRAQPVEESGNLPLTVINYVARSEKTVVFDNISKDPNYSSDPYIKKYQPKSVGCFPIIRKEKLSAIIYLENNLVEGAFTPERIKVLNTLAAQIAISLENAGIYRELDNLNKGLEQKVEDRTKEIAEKNLVLEQQSQQLKELDTLKSRFFANISHEFRTPLTLILGPLEQMLTVPQEKEGEQKRKMRLMLRNSQRLLGLINQLLDLSKFDSGSMKLQACRQNVVPFLKGILNSFDSLAEQNDQLLIFHAAADEITLYFDPPRLEELMANLLSNAVKFTPAGGQITITVGVTNDGAAGDFLEISVRDTGPGIPEDQLPHIFDRFYQADSTHEHHHKGSGIGLSIAKEIVELHHGTISARIIHEKGQKDGESGEPVKPGGTEFVVRLPMGDAHLEPGEIVEKSAVAWKMPDETPGATGAPQSDSIRRKIRDLYLPDEADTGECPPLHPDAEQLTAEAGTGKDIILVVEDSADMRLYIRGALEPLYTVVEANDGQQGLQKAREIIPDLIICDVMMPVMDGYDACRALKADVAVSHIPIILLTAKAGEESIVTGLECGADDYITKPFSTKILCARIKNLIDLRRHLQETLKREMTLQPVNIKVSTVDEDFLKDLYHVLAKNMADTDFNVEDLSRKLYMNRVTLYRKINALTGENPTDFIRSYRLKRGAELLKTTDKSVLEVALDVGFGGSSYFIKCFKEKFHQLPSEYQRTEKMKES